MLVLKYNRISLPKYDKPSLDIYMRCPLLVQPKCAHWAMKTMYIYGICKIFKIPYHKSIILVIS